MPDIVYDFDQNNIPEDAKFYEQGIIIIELTMQLLD